MKISPLKSIRKFCLWCGGDNAKEVELCPSEDCEFYPIRFGKGKKGYSVLKAIKRKCRDCGEGTYKSVKNCEFPDCQIYKFRTGHNPELKGKRGKCMLRGINPFKPHVIPTDLAKKGI